MIDETKLKQLAEKIGKSDAVVIGAGSGLSSAAGFDHYHKNEWFTEQFAAFEETYGFQNLFEGFYHVYNTPEEEWGFVSKYIELMYDAPPGQPYLDLYEIVKEKSYFVLTSNADMQCSKTFPEDRICLFQGDFRFFQCSQPCHDQVYDNRNLIDAMMELRDGLKILPEAVPRCPECGRRMIPWVRDYEFLEGMFWKDGVRRYQEFLQEHLLRRKEQVLFLELGVGDMTPSVIRLPFWDMVKNNENTFYASVNIDKVEEPEHIKERAIAVSADIGAVLRKIRQWREEAVYEDSADTKCDNAN